MNESSLCPICSGPVDRTGPRGSKRVYCSDKCRWTADNRRKGHPPRELHTLTEVDEAKRLATCSHCGLGTKIWSGGTKRERWRCANRVRGQVSRARDLDPTLERVRKARSNGADVTVESFREAEARADGLCESCGQGEPLCIDHDHYSGRFRGLVCVSCNTGIGKLGDTEAGLLAALEYVRRNSPARLTESQQRHVLRVRRIRCDHPAVHYIRGGVAEGWCQRCRAVAWDELPQVEKERLSGEMDADWLRGAADYLDRAGAVGYTGDSGGEAHAGRTP